METIVDFIFDYVDRYISVCGSEHGDAVPMEPEEGVGSPGARVYAGVGKQFWSSIRASSTLNY